MEHCGDPHALYAWDAEKREDAMTYLYDRALSSGRLKTVKPKDEAADMARLFGSDFPLDDPERGA